MCMFIREVIREDQDTRHRLAIRRRVATHRQAECRGIHSSNPADILNSPVHILLSSLVVILLNNNLAAILLQIMADLPRYVLLAILNIKLLLLLSRRQAIVLRYASPKHGYHRYHRYHHGPAYRKLGRSPALTKLVRVR